MISIELTSPICTSNLFSPALPRPFNLLIADQIKLEAEVPLLLHVNVVFPRVKFCVQKHLNVSISLHLPH